ncbi:TIR domain-containing protein [Leifsonia sp. C5G2]|uniref:TIR domain-containing protein n=1 Tax=Leifsonia sp. C5G2 TaxID=2735269 RepID=UPI001584682C|nr:TIR domain-containing protein [Leifsonia sp. C5G2]NUU06190.1 TIR domain-containing protein [Leifsonia sp. C5G2]
MAIDVEQMKMVRNLSHELTSLPLADVNLLLHSAGITEIDPYAWYGDINWDPTADDRLGTVTTLIRDLSRSELIGLSAAVHELFSSPALATPHDGSPALRLFASHLTAQRGLVGQVSDHLARWNVDLFVAHSHIEPDAEWHAAIEASLRTVHAGVVFLHHGFNESKWCDQEVGWLLGRGVPLRTLMFNHENPYGPLGKLQAMEIPDGWTASKIGDSLLDWAAQRSELKSSFASSMALSLAGSRSFDRTNAVWARLDDYTDLDGAQVATIASALRDNDQVFGPEFRVNGPDYGKWFPEVVLRKLLSQPGYAVNRELLEEVAAVRGVELASNA